MSFDLKKYLHEKVKATSCTTPYNPQDNGLVESQKFASYILGNCIPDALQLIQSLIFISTNCTPHEKMFNFKWYTSTGTSLPTWLSHSGPVFLKRPVQLSKYDPLVDEVELIKDNSSQSVFQIAVRGRGIRNFAGGDFFTE